MIEFGKRDPALEYLERTGAYAIVQDDFRAIAVIRTTAFTIEESAISSSPG